jgi:5-methyltetrahydrofolate--homocysteine methyltransferase
LVNTILSNNGYTVFDLGKQVPANVILDKAIEVDATAIGLSALLVSTSKQMPLIVNELHRRGLHFPVLIGGAAINRRFGRRILFTESGAPYDAGVFYCKDAFEGLDTMEKLIDPAERGDLIGRIIAEAEAEVGKLESSKLGVGKSGVGKSGDVAHQSTNYQATNIPTPPFWGSHVIREMPLEIVLQHLDVNELYRLQWGAKNTHGNEWVKLRDEFTARLDRMKREAIRSGYLKPQAVYGYYPAQACGNTLIVYDPNDRKIEIARFEFPRQPGQDNLALSDYFASAESGVMDVVAFQVVTVGHRARIRNSKLQSRRYSAYFVRPQRGSRRRLRPSMCISIRRELNIDAKRGKRLFVGTIRPAPTWPIIKRCCCCSQVSELGLEPFGCVSVDSRTDRQPLSCAPSGGEILLCWRKIAWSS